MAFARIVHPLLPGSRHISISIVMLIGWGIDLSALPISISMQKLLPLPDADVTQPSPDRIIIRFVSKLIIINF